MKRTYIKQRICHLGGKTKNKKKDFYLFLCWWLDYCLYLQPALLVGKYLKGLEVKYSEEEKEEKKNSLICLGTISCSKGSKTKTMHQDAPRRVQLPNG